MEEEIAELRELVENGVAQAEQIQMWIREKLQPNLQNMNAQLREEIEEVRTLAESKDSDAPDPSEMKEFVEQGLRRMKQYVDQSMEKMSDEKQNSSAPAEDNSQKFAELDAKWQKQFENLQQKFTQALKN